MYVVTLNHEDGPKRSPNDRLTTSLERQLNAIREAASSVENHILLNMPFLLRFPSPNEFKDDKHPFECSRQESQPYVDEYVNDAINRAMSINELDKDYKLADLLGVSASAISQWRKNPIKIPADRAESIARAAKTTVDAIRCGTSKLSQRAALLEYLLETNEWEKEDVAIVYGMIKDEYARRLVCDALKMAIRHEQMNVTTP